MPISSAISHKKTVAAGKPTLFFLLSHNTFALGLCRSSEAGRQLFKEAMLEGYMEGYFRLAEQFRTQDDPAFCGLSTLTMVLNALSVDPGRVWKGSYVYVCVL